jgi:uncharacterized repeat protein (TIGR01451 family)
MVFGFSQNKKYFYFWIALMLSIVAFSPLFGQATFTTNPTNAQINNALQGNGVTISNGSLEAGRRDRQIAIFSNGIVGANFEINEGVLFSTGLASFDLSNRNSTNNRSFAASPNYSDPDLTAINPNARFDPVVYSFDVTLGPVATALRIEFQFGSEEYPDYVGSVFNDVFGFFVTGPGIPGTENMARLPSNNNIIAVNTVNGGVLGASNTGQPTDLNQTEFYINNGHLNTGAPNPNPQPGPFPIFIEYNGITRSITYFLTGLTPGETYRFKSAIADVGDSSYDSGVLLKAITGVPETDLSIVKTIDDISPAVGQTVNFTLTASNLGPFDADEVTVTDLLPSGYSFVSASSSTGTYDPVTGIWEIGAFPNGDIQTLTITATVNSSGNYENIATILGGTVADPNLDNNTSIVTIDSPCDQIPGQNAINGLVFDDLNLDGFLDSGEPGLEGYTVEVYEDLNGNGVLDTGEPLISTGTTIANGTFSIGVAPNLENVRDEFNTNGSGSGNNGSVNWVGNWSEIGESNGFGTGRVRVANNQLEIRNQNYGASRTVNLTGAAAAILSFDFEGLGLNATRNAIVQVSENPGGPWTTIVIINNNTPGTFEADISSFISSTTTIRIFTSVASFWNDTRGVNIDNINIDYFFPGDYLVALSNPLPPGVVQTSAPIVFPISFATVNEVVCEVNFGLWLPRADLEIVKTVDDLTPDVGSNVVFEIAVQNFGPNPTTGAVVNDLLPSGYTFVSSNPSQGTYDAATGIWDIGNLNVGQLETIEITAQVNASGDYNNIATTSSNLEDLNLSNNTSSISTTPVPQTDLQVNKSVNDSNPSVGDNITFTVSITNNGPSDATGVAVDDLIPSGFNFVSASSSAGTYNSGTGIWTVGNLGNGASETLTITATVLESGDFVNVAVISGNENDPIPGNNTSQAEAFPPGTSPNDLEIEKISDAGAFVLPGEEITYTITVTNPATSSITHTGVSVLDDLPAGTTFIPGSVSVSLDPSPSTATNLRLQYQTSEANASTQNISTQFRVINDDAVDVALTDIFIRYWFSSEPPGNDIYESDFAQVGTGNITSAFGEINGERYLELGFTSAATVPTWSGNPSGTPNLLPPGANTSDISGRIRDSAWGNYNQSDDFSWDPSFSSFADYTNATLYYQGEVVWGSTPPAVPSASGSGTISDPPNLASDWTLVPGTVMTVTFSVTVNDPIFITEIDNIASVSSNERPFPIFSETVTDPVLQEADVFVLKSVDNPTPEVGETVIFTISVGNNGPVPAQGVNVLDNIPSGFSVVSVTPSAGTWSAPNWNLGTLLNGVTETLEIVATVNEPGASVSYVNTAIVSSTGPNDPDLSNNEDEVTVTPVVISSIDLSKSASPGSYSAAGEEITYTFTVENTGNVTLEDITITDALPGLSGISPASVPSLAPGATAVFTASYTITQSDVDNGSVGNTATATGTFDGDDYTSSDTETVTAAQGPAISLDKSASPGSYSAAGEEITYTFTVENTGNVTLEDITITDALPGLSGISPASVPSLAPGATAVFTASYTITQSDVDNGSVGNTATATGTFDGDDYTSSDTETVTAAQGPAISLDKSASPGSYSAAGEEITYTFTVENTGNVTLEDITITDALPGLSGISPASVPSLAPGATAVFTASYTITQSDVDNGSVGNTATATGTFDGDDYTSSDTETVTAAQGPAISLDKSASPGSYSAAGEEITYTFTVENTGNVTLEDITITDALPGLSGISPASVPSLAPGATAVFTASYTITQSDVDNGSVGNTATATGTFDGDDYTSSDTETVTAAQGPAISLDKSASPGSYSAAGEEITYTFTVENTGNVTLEDITITDALPGLSGISPASVPSLAPGATAVFTASYTITQSDVDNGSVGNTATATGTFDGDDYTSSDTETVTAAQGPAISLDKSASPGSYSAAGEEITYTFTVENTGNVTLEDITITDALPGLSGISPASVPSLAPGATAVFTASYTITQSDVDNGSVGNTATATGTFDGDDYTSSDTETVTAAQGPAISLDKSASPGSYSAAGEEITYTFTVENTGNVTLEDITITDALPGLSGISPASVPSLAPGATAVFTASYTITQSDVDNGSVGNTATCHGYF